MQASFLLLLQPLSELVQLDTFIDTVHNLVAVLVELWNLNVRPEVPILAQLLYHERLEELHSRVHTETRKHEDRQQLVTAGTHFIYIKVLLLLLASSTPTRPLGKLLVIR